MEKRRYLTILGAILLVQGSVLTAHAEVDAKHEVNTEKLCELLMQGGDLTVENQKALARNRFLKPNELKQQLALIRLSGSDKDSKRANELIAQLDGDAGTSLQTKFIGMTVGWHVFLKSEKICSLPMVIEVEKGSLAEKAGFIAGDVITQCDQFQLEGDNTRNQFVILASLWPKSEPLKLSIKRSKYPGADKGTLKNINKDLTLFGKD